MPKRVADEYITKEHGATPNVEDDKPKMSTAAQLARRKMAQPRGRLGASRSHPSSHAVPKASSQNPPQQQPFGALNGGINFGSSQSFPQGSVGNNNSFSFQAPQSSSFTFGAPSDTHNPFANLNGSSDSQDISMESPSKKANFGTNAGPNNFTFGQTAQGQSNPFGGLGGNQSTGTNGKNLFGQPAAASAPSNPFGQPAQSQSFGGFGQQASAAQPQGSGFSGFGSTTNPSAPSTGTTFGGFGKAASVTGQSALPAFGTQQPAETQPQSQPSKFTFGQTTSTSQPPGTGLFGSATPAGGSSGSSSSSSVFGSAPAPSASSGFNFGQSSNQKPPSDNPFANLSGSKPEEPKPATSLFGAPASTPQPATESQQASAPPANPFGSLFGGATGAAQAAPAQKPLFSFGTPTQPPAAAENQDATPAKPAFAFGTTSQPEPKISAEESQPKPVKSPFTFGATNQPAATTIDSNEPKSSTSGFKFGSTTSSTGSTTSGLFGKLASPEKSEHQPDASHSAAAPEPKDTAPTSGFKFGSPSQAVSSGGLFSPAKSTSESNTSSGGLFSKLNSAVETPSKSPPLFGAQSKPANSGFSATASNVATDTSTKTAEPAKPTEAPNATATPVASSQARQAQHLQPSQKPQSPSPAASTTPASLKANRPVSSDSATQAPKVTDSVANSALMLEPIKRPVYTKGPSRVPGHTNAQQFQEYDRDYRLHSLNHGLQRKLATLDPRSHDFDNIIRHYVAARDNIGASLGLYVRNVAGTKRKGDQVDDREEEREQNKRSREDPEQKSFSFGSPTSAGSATPRANTAAPTTSKPTESDDDATPKPASSGTAGVSQSTANALGTSTMANPFASLTREASSAPIAPSTTPTKSPPKKSGFEVPKFGGNSNTNFMAAFGQQAKQNAAKFEKDLMEKRKAEEFDSDEDDEEAYRKKVEEEARAKRAKIESVAKGGFTPSFGAGAKEKEPKPTFSGSKSTSTSKPLFGSAGTAQEKEPKTSFSGFGTNSTSTKKPLFGSANASQEKETKSAFAGFGTNSTSKPFGATSSLFKAQEPKAAPISGETSPLSFTDLTPAPITYGQPEADRHDDNDEHDDDYTDDKDDDEVEVSGSSNDQAEDGDDEEQDYAYGELEEEAEESLPEDEVVQENGDQNEEDDDDENDFQAAMARSRTNPNAGKSLFDRIEPNPDKEKSRPTTNGDKKTEAETSPILQPAKNSSFAPSPWGSHIGKSTPDQPAFSPFTPTTDASTVKPASTFNFTPSAPTTTPTPAPGASIFSGGATRDGPVPGEGLFGSRPSTPSNGEQNGNLARSVLTSPAGTDNTWKQGSSISFGNGDKPTSAPSFKFTAASPGEKDKSSSNSLSTLFGTPATGSSGTAAPSLGFKFGAPASAPAPGFLGAVSHLGGGSAASSAASSRATSPGLTDNESVATNDTEETSDDPQTSLMDSRTGEENESTLWEGRSKALMFTNEEQARGTKHKVNDWNSMGVGMLRVLKDKTTNKTRVVFRVEPSANILFNSHLIGSTSYESVPGQKSGAVRGALMHKGNLTRLVFKLKNTEMADGLAKVLEENKSTS